MSKKLTAIKSLHRYHCFSEQVALCAHQNTLRTVKDAEQNYQRALDRVNDQASWKSTVDNQLIDVTLYAAASCCEAIALEEASAQMQSVTDAKTALLKAHKHLQLNVSKLKSSERRLWQQTNDEFIVHEKRLFDQLSDTLLIQGVNNLD